MVIDLKDLKTILEREIEDRFDHRDLVDDTSYFEKQTATPENFARVIFDLLRPALAGLLDRVRLYQDPDHFVDVSAEAANP
jgi:6-pyruvoyltetrahydropterin/6-carboxytetrahydropterin synthase